MTLVLLYYEQPEMLRRQLRFMFEYPLDVRENLHVVLVDDGGPTQAGPIVAASDVYVHQSLASLRVYRTLVDVLWNEEFATNLGVSLVRTEWFLHADLDHEAPASTLRDIMEFNHDPGAAYMLRRLVDGPGGLKAIAPSASCWFMTREMFDRIGGLDERFAGGYAPSDIDFRTRAELAARVEVLGAHLVAHLDGSCPGVQRTFGRRERLRYDRVVAARGSRPPLRMRSPWRRVL